MINLLPIEQKKQLHQEYGLRVVLVAVVMFIVTIIVGMALLLPSFFLSKAKESAVFDQAAFLEQKADIETANALQNIVSQTKQQLAVLRSEGSSNITSTIVSSALSHKPEGVSLKSISLESTAEGVSLSIGGTAKSRGELTRFVSALEKDPLFQEVTFPVSNLAKESDINFTIQARSSL